MSERGPSGPHVYQPYGSVSDPARNREGRLWGVGGVPMATIMGLTREEAKAVAAVLAALLPVPAEVAKGGG
jgi:hypothetical protein